MINLDADIYYLNHAAVAPWPQCSVDAVKEFAEENGKTGAKNYLRWLEYEKNLREQFQKLINAPSIDDISLLKSTSEGLSFVASGITWQPGDNIIFFQQEFPSNRVVWEALEARQVECRKVDLYQEDPEGALLASIDEHTRLISVSSVQYARGLKMDLKRIAQACRQHKILLCIDAIQSLGISPMDVQALDADFLVADGHKWMLGPEGLALFYCRGERRQELQLTEYGWHMLDQRGDYDRQDWTPAKDGKRFECGSPNLLGTVALLASVNYLMQTGIQNVEKKIRENIQFLIAALESTGDFEILTNIQASRLAGIITFKHKRLPAETLYPMLMQRGLICAARGGGIRFSPHFYQDTHLLQQAIDCLQDCVQTTP